MNEKVRESIDLIRFAAEEVTRKPISEWTQDDIRQAYVNLRVIEEEAQSVLNS
jgi:hypothetical protein